MICVEFFAIGSILAKCNWICPRALRWQGTPAQVARPDQTDIGLKTDLLHWGTRYTRTPLYRKQVNDLHTLERGGSRMVLFLHTVQYGTAEARDRAVRFAQRGWNKLGRMLHIK